MNTNLASTLRRDPSLVLREVTRQEPSAFLVMPSTSVERFSLKVGWPCRYATYWRVTSPHSTSVPSGDQVAATFWFGSRPSIIRGTHFLSCSGSVEYSMPANSGLAFRASQRFFR